MCAISWKKERLNRLINYITDLMNNELKRICPEAAPLFTSKSITSFIRNGCNWKCQFIRETDYESNLIDHKDTIWKRIQYSTKAPSVDKKLLKPFERASLSTDCLYLCGLNFNENSLKHSHIFWDYLNDLEEETEIQDFSSPYFWNSFKSELQKKISKDFGSPELISDIIVMLLAIATRGTESTTPTPSIRKTYQFHVYTEKETTLEKKFINQLKNISHYAIGGRKGTGKTAFVIKSLENQFSEHLFYTTYSTWETKYIFKLDQEIWKKLDLDCQIPLNLPPKVINKRGLSTYLHEEGILIIDDIPQEQLNKITNELNFYKGKIIFIVNNQLHETNCNIPYINIPKLTCSDWIQILSKKVNLTTRVEKIIQEIFDSVQGEIIIISIISDTIDYLQATNADQIIPFLYKVRNDVCQNSNHDNKQPLFINNQLSKYRVNSTLDTSQTTFEGHIKKALEWINAELSPSDKQLLYFLMLTQNISLTLNELNMLYGITEKDLSNLLSIGWITLCNNSIVLLQMSSHIIQLVISFDTPEVNSIRFSCVCKYIKIYIQNCNNNSTGLFFGRLKEIFKFTYHNIVNELLSTKNNTTPKTTANETKKLLTTYIMIGLYFSYNCGDLELARALLKYTYPLKSYNTYQNKNYNLVIDAFIKDITWIENRHNDWLPSFFSQLRTSHYTFTEQEKNMMAWITMRDIERNIFYLVSSNNVNVPLLFQELQTVSGTIVSYYNSIIKMQIDVFYAVTDSIDNQICLLDKIIQSCNIANSSPDLLSDQHIKYQVFVCIQICEFIEHSSYKQDLVKYQKQYLEKTIDKLEQSLDHYQYSSLCDFIYIVYSLLLMKTLLSYNEDSLNRDKFRLLDIPQKLGYSLKDILNYFYSIKEITSHNFSTKDNDTL